MVCQAFHDAYDGKILKILEFEISGGEVPVIFISIFGPRWWIYGANSLGKELADVARNNFPLRLP